MNGVVRSLMTAVSNRARVQKLRMPIVLVEPAADDAEEIARLLKAASDVHFEIEWAEHADAGIERIAQGDIALVLLGVALPDGNALAALRAFRDAAPEVPVVVLTGFHESRFFVQALSEGAQDCLTKANLEVRTLERAAVYAAERHQLIAAYARELWAANVIYGDYLSIVRNSADAIIVIDEFGRIQFVNPAAEAMLGLSASDAVGQPFRYPLDLREPFEVDIEAFDGSMRKVEIRIVSTSWRGGSAYLAMARDMTLRRELESQLAQAQKLESVGRLAAGIAHEINTPTQFITDNTRYLGDAFEKLRALLEAYQPVVEAAKTAGLAPDLVEAVAAAETRARLKSLLRDVPEAVEDSLDGLQQVARIVGAMKVFAHPGTPDRTPVDIRTAIESTIAVARNEWKHVGEVITDFESDLPLVPAVPGDLNQVLLNLVINAVHAIADARAQGIERPGEIRVGAHLDGEHVAITVADNGVGIPEGVRERVFDPFFTTKEVGRGTGQGLSISRSIVVERHGGTIEVESTPGEGTVFTVRLPLHEVEQAAA